MLIALLDAAILVAIAAVIAATRGRFPVWQRAALVATTSAAPLLLLLRHAQEAFGVEPYPWPLTCGLVMTIALVSPMWSDALCDTIDALRNRPQRTRATVATQVDSILDEWVKEN